MNFIYKLFKLNPESRKDIIAVTSGLGIFTNVLIAGTKVIIGTLTGSIAIVSEGINNAADALTSVLTFVGAKLAAKHPDEKHPFGYGRIEYLTGLVIAVLIIVSGIEVLKSSIDLIIHPEPLSISYLSLAIVAVSAVLKYLLGSYTMKMGKKADSSALIGVGADSKNDCFASLVTIISSAVFLIFGLSLDAYAGIITSLLILKAGLEVLTETLSEIIGRPGDEDLARKLFKEIRETEGIINAADMMLHNYGPDAWSGSVNVELDHKLTVGEAYKFLHKLQLHIMHDYHVTMVFGIYAVDNDGKEAHQLRSDIAAFIREREHVKSYHAVYFEKDTGTIYCDLIVDYKLKDWDALREDFLAYMKKLYPDNPVELVIETEFV